MEDTLRGKKLFLNPFREVLILVLMEDTLREAIETYFNCYCDCLNPCSNGRYSQSSVEAILIVDGEEVLILVLMEDTLRGAES